MNLRRERALYMRAFLQHVKGGHIPIVYGV